MGVWWRGDERAADDGLAGAGRCDDHAVVEAGDGVNRGVLFGAQDAGEGELDGRRCGSAVLQAELAAGGGEDLFDLGGRPRGMISRPMVSR